jgi:hypothetical protein
LGSLPRDYIQQPPKRHRFPFRMVLARQEQTSPSV